MLLYPLQFSVERVSGLQEASLLVLVAIFDLEKFGLQLPLKHRARVTSPVHKVPTMCPRTLRSNTHLVHHERLDLPLQDLHAGCGDHRADVGHHDLAEDVADEPVVPLEAGGRYVLHREAVVVVWTEGKTAHVTDLVQRERERTSPSLRCPVRM